MGINSTRLIALQKLNKHYKISNTKQNIKFDSEKKLSKLDQALVNEIVTGVIRWQLKLDFILDKILSRGLKHTDPQLVNILRIGLYQILFMNKIPDYAILNETVNLTKYLAYKKYATSLVNSVLRELLRNPELNKAPDREKNLLEYLSIQYSHPKSLVKHWLRIFSEEETEKLLEKNNERAKITFRINNLLASNEEIKQYLDENKIDYSLNKYYENIFVINKSSVNLEENPLFKEGKITVQDASAVIATKLLAPNENSFVIDMCASPGGKTCHLADMMQNKGKILANDISKQRTDLIVENINRLKVKNTEISISDALNINEDIKANYILLDAPCTGSGIIRKLPEIKYLNREKTLKKTVETQRKLLEKATKLLKENGVIIYSTCSIEPAENMENVMWFLKNFPQFSLEKADNYVNSFFCKNDCVQIFTHIHDCNGAFAARLKHNT